jgi:hypothetical protein
MPKKMIVKITNLSLRGGDSRRSNPVTLFLTNQTKNKTANKIRQLAMVSKLSVIGKATNKGIEAIKTQSESFRGLKIK